VIAWEESMPKKTKIKRYKVDTDIFMEVWYKAVEDKDKIWSFAKFLEELQKKCDADPRNKGLSKKLDETTMLGKMNYYRKSWGLDIARPTTEKKGLAREREERKKMYMEKFKKAGYKKF